MNLFSKTAIALCLFAPLGVSQACAALSVTGSGKPGTALELKLTGGKANSHVLLALSAKAGKTTFNFGPLGSLVLGLASPVAKPVIGRADKNGALTVSLKIPKNFPAFDLKGQAVTGGLTVTKVPGKRASVKFDFCTSNVVSIKGGKT
jgi:hypothetical protein